MKGTHLGEFEEIILLTIASLVDNAYGLAIKKEIEAESNRTVTISAVHAACNRLEDKGFLKSHFGDKSEHRGGKRKKLYQVSQKGQQALRDARDLRLRLWNKIPRTSFDS